MDRGSNNILRRPMQDALQHAVVRHLRGETLLEMRSQVTDALSKIGDAPWAIHLVGLRENPNEIVKSGLLLTRRHRPPCRDLAKAGELQAFGNILLSRLR